MFLHPADRPLAQAYLKQIFYEFSSVLRTLVLKKFRKNDHSEKEEKSAADSLVKPLTCKLTSKIVYTIEDKITSFVKCWKFISEQPCETEDVPPKMTTIKLDFHPFTKPVWD